MLLHTWFRVVMLVGGGSIVGVSGGTGQEYLERYLKEAEVGYRCHTGFITLSQRIKDAAARCAKIPVFGSYVCFLVCVYREFKYIVPGTSEIDSGMADLVTFESFDMTSKTGRDGYWEVALKRYLCKESYAKDRDFPMTYEDAEKCEPARDFFTCQWKSLTCSRYPVTD